jgi:hypothetical protein
MDRQFLQSFEGSKGRSDLYEIVGFNFDHPHLEHVEYEIIYHGAKHTAFTMGEAAIVGCELAGDRRFLRPVTPAPPRTIVFTGTYRPN